jgi:sorbitol/mannitol transport system substrate-binding protein
MANSYGARWFDENWQPQFESPEWRAAITDYLDLLTNYGPPGASSNGFNENLTLFQQGSCGMWIDATVAGSFVTDPNNSTVADRVGFALAPDAGQGKRANWLWAWSLAIPTSSDAPEEAKQFLAWATGTGYTDLVAESEGIANVPPGTRTSLYQNQEYLDAAPFAQMTIDSINAVDPTNPTRDPVPYTGVQFVAIPEFQGLGTEVGQIFSDALAGNKTVDEALAEAQAVATQTMTEGGYITQ